MARETNAFPVLLLLVSVARQGHIEAVAVYTVARALGVLNAQAISAHEGIGAPTYLDAKVSELEATNTLLPIAFELYELFEKEVGPYLLVFFAFSLTVSAVFFLTPIVLFFGAWYATTSGVYSVGDYLLNLGAPDPLDF